MDRINSFVNLYNSRYTKKSYKYILKYFFQTIYPANSDIHQRRTSTDALNAVADQYFTEDRNYEADIQAFQQTLNGRPPKTTRTMLACVKSFLIENNVELSQRFWKRSIGRVRGSRARINDKVPSVKELRQIMAHLPLQGRALFLLLLSSGMRIGEGLALNLTDIDLDTDPMTINVRGEITKTGNRRWAFASSEAKDAIQEWLHVRKDYIQTAVQRSVRYTRDDEGNVLEKIYLKSRDDMRLFPFTDHNARHMWNEALAKSQNGEKDESVG
jgi:integrase